MESHKKMPLLMHVSPMSFNNDNNHHNNNNSNKIYLFDNGGGNTRSINGKWQTTPGPIFRSPNSMDSMVGPNSDIMTSFPGVFGINGLDVQNIGFNFNINLSGSFNPQFIMPCLSSLYQRNPFEKGVNPLVSTSSRYGGCSNMDNLSWFPRKLCSQILKNGIERHNLSTAIPGLINSNFQNDMALNDTVRITSASLDQCISNVKMQTKDTNSEIHHSIRNILKEQENRQCPNYCFDQVNLLRHKQNKNLRYQNDFITSSTPTSFKSPDQKYIVKETDKFDGISMDLDENKVMSVIKTSNCSGAAHTSIGMFTSQSSESSTHTRSTAPQITTNFDIMDRSFMPDNSSSHSRNGNDRNNSRNQLHQVFSDRKMFQCPQCRYLTDRKNNLKRHIVTMHQDSGKALECCGIPFQNKAALRDHNSVFHKGGYRCQICARNFCRKALLRRHLTVHSGQKDFFCDLCGYATSHKSNLERHQKVHMRRSSETASFDGFKPSSPELIYESSNDSFTAEHQKSKHYDPKESDDYHNDHLGNIDIDVTELEESQGDIQCPSSIPHTYSPTFAGFPPLGHQNHCCHRKAKRGRSRSSFFTNRLADTYSEFQENKERRESSPEMDKKEYVPNFEREGEVKLTSSIPQNKILRDGPNYKTIEINHIEDDNVDGDEQQPISVCDQSSVNYFNENHTRNNESLQDASVIQETNNTITCPSNITKQTKTEEQIINLSKNKFQCSVQILEKRVIVEEERDEIHTEVLKNSEVLNSEEIIQFNEDKRLGIAPGRSVNDNRIGRKRRHEESKRKLYSVCYQCDGCGEKMTNQIDLQLHSCSKNLTGQILDVSLLTALTRKSSTEINGQS